MAILGDDARRASETLIAARREAKLSQDSWYSRLVGDTGHKRLVRLLQKRTLTELEQAGFAPADIVEAGLDISVLERFTPTELHAHGFTWDTLVSLGVGGGDLRRFTWTELNLFRLGAEEVFNLSTTAHDVFSMGLSVQQLHTLGFTRANLSERGATLEQLEEIFGPEDVRMYLGGESPPRPPSPPEEKSVTFTF